MRALYRNNRKQIDLATHLGDLDDRRQAGQAAADHDNFRIHCHFYFIALRSCPFPLSAPPPDQSAAEDASGRTSSCPVPRRSARKRTQGTRSETACGPFLPRQFPISRKTTRCRKQNATRRPTNQRQKTRKAESEKLPS